MDNQKPLTEALLGSFSPVDDEYNIYLSLWVKYHRECELFDRQISPTGVPRNAMEHSKMLSNASLTFRKYLRVYVKDTNKWQSAKREAVRIVEKEFENEPQLSRS